MRSSNTYFATMDDIIFAERNMNYGAYMLRKMYVKSIWTALLVTVSGFALAIAIPEIIRYIQGPTEVIEAPVMTTTITELLPPPPITPTPPPPQIRMPQPQPQVNTIRFLPPALTDRDVPTEEMPDMTAVREADVIGSINHAGDANAEIPEFDVEVPEVGEIGDAPTEDPIFIAVEVAPSFPDMGKFLKRNLDYPDAAIRNEIEGVVYLSFIVSKDGSLSEITILKGISKECDEEAIRVVKKMPRWKPGMQSGRPVPVRFSLSIRFSLNR